MNSGQLERAIRRALTLFDNWQRVTGCLEGSSYEWEIRGIIEDAVHCGAQEALGVYKPLDAEQDNDA